MIDHTKFAEMLCTRFSHDITGPIGAVSNGAEFLREEVPTLQSQALDLIESSSREAVARVQFYRQSYGTLGGTSAASLTDAKNLSLGYFLGTKIELIWDDKYTDISPVQISNIHKKLILNLLIICSSILIRGGKIIFSIDESKTNIRCEGTSIKLAPEVEDILNGKQPNVLDPKLVQVIYTQSILSELGKKLEINKADTHLEFNII